MSGPIRIHPDNPRIFELGGEARVLCCATEHYGAVLNGAFRFERYLDEAARRRQTLTRLFLLYRELQSELNPWSPCKPESPDYIAPYPRSAGGRAADGLARFDLDRWNPLFFDRLHRFIAMAAERGIVVEATLFSNTYGPNVWALNPLNPRNNVNGTEEITWPEYIAGRHPELMRRQLAWARKAARELARYDNVIIELCNEPGGGATDVPRAPSCAAVDAWQQEIASAVREVEQESGRRHLLAGQEAFSYAPFTQTTDASFSDSMPFDIVNVHPLPGTVHRGRSYDLGAFESGELRLHEFLDFCLSCGSEAKPVNLDEDNAASRFLDEGGWTIHRKRAWVALMSLCHYDVIDFSIAPWREQGTPDSRAGIRSWMGHLARFMHSLDLTAARPATGLVAGRPAHTIAAALAVADREYAVYLADDRERGEPGGGEEIEGSLSLSLPQGDWEVSCLAPATGMQSPWLPLDGGRKPTVRPPRFRHDILIRLRRHDDEDSNARPHPRAR